MLCGRLSLSTPLRRAVSPTKQKAPPTMAALVIGDEVLKGHVLDTNTRDLAKFGRERGIVLKRSVVVPDEFTCIAETSRALSDAFDVVVTSGGIGSTHDDITYAALSREFGDGKLEVHKQTKTRFEHTLRRQGKLAEEDSLPSASLRMCQMPAQNTEVLTPSLDNHDLWVPMAVVNRNIFVLPGVPRLFRMMLDEFEFKFPLDRNNVPKSRTLFTPMFERDFSDDLRQVEANLQLRDGASGTLTIGSYPISNKVDENHCRLIVESVDDAELAHAVERIGDVIQISRVAS